MGPLQGVTIMSWPGWAPAVRHVEARRHRRQRDPSPPTHEVPDDKPAHRDGDSTAASARSPSTSSRPRAWRRCCAWWTRPTCCVEAFRPGVTERLGIGPDVLLARNPAPRLRPHDRLGPGRPARPRAGHDIDYIAITGALGRSAAPASSRGPASTCSATSAAAACSWPSAWCAPCSSAALGQGPGGRRRDGRRRRVAAARSSTAAGLGCTTRPLGTNLLDTGAPFYDTYETSDGEYIAVGAIEPQFYAQLLERLGLDAAELPAQNDASRWPELRERFTEAFATKTRDEWAKMFNGTDVLLAPVLPSPRRPTTRTTSPAACSSTSPARSSGSRRRRT